MTITQSSTRLVAVAAGAVLALGLMFGALSAPAHAAALSQTQIQSILSLLSSFGADQATINNVSAALNGQATTGTGTTGSTTGGSSAACYSWTRDLTSGSTGADVQALQVFLNTNAATQVSASGAGSPGMETSYFGPATKAALSKFQQLNSVSPSSGYFGPLTRAKIASMCSSGSTTGGSTGTTGGSTGTTGTATVSAAAQPANTIIPSGVARAPFTKFTVSANGGDVTLNSVTVERQGISKDADLSGVELLDQNGNIIGLTRTLNSNHQAVIGSPVVIPAGTSQTFTVAADTGSTGNSGDVVSLAVVAVNSNAAVNGALPIVGANQTMNTLLSIGSVTVAKGTNDPGAANTENVGTNNYIFSSIRLTAGSVEDVYVKSIRWHQVGSMSQSYLSDVATLVNGQTYPTTVTSDNYYTTTFPGQGILITKGNSLDVAIQGDIVNGSSNLTAEFDVQKRNDINVVGAMYGYGILPSFNTNGSATAGTVNSSDDPYYKGFTTTVSAGTINVSTSNTASAANIAINQQNQVLGGYTVQILGEPVTVGKMVFNLFTSSSAATIGDITSVSLVDQNGSVLAGPVDAVGTAKTGTVTFTDTVTLPVGTTQLFLKGKLGTDFVTNDTVSASTTPSTQWTTVTGQTTGKSLTASPSSALQSATMTVKAAALTASVASTPIAQTVIAGTNQFDFADLILDATASGEDVRVTTVPVTYTYTGNANDLTNCQLYNGSTSVSDQHVVNPTSSNTSGSAVSFSLNSGGVVIPHGTTLTLSVKCDIRSGASGTYKWGFLASPAIGASGVTSGNTVTASGALNAGQLMTASNTGGSLTVTLDSSTPSYGVASAGSTGVDLGHLRFSGGTEAVDLKQVALQLTSGSNTDLVGNQVTLWDADTNTQVGTAVFPTGVYATSSAIAAGSFRIPANGSKTLIIKGDLAAIGVNGPVTKSGDEVKVSYDGNNIGTNGNYGVGVQSGKNITPSTNTDVTTNGVTVYKSFPTFTYSTSGGTLFNGSNTLMTLTVAADAKGDVRLGKLEFTVATTTVTVTAPTFSGPNGAVGASAPTLTSNLLTVNFDSTTNTSDRIIPAGTSKTFTLRGTVAGLTGNNSGTVSVALKADSSIASMAKETSVSGANVWSPLSTTTTGGALTDNDWTNSYGLGGCFTSVGLGNDCTANVLAK